MSIDQTGLYTADDGEGEFTVRATIGELSSSAVVTVSPRQNLLLWSEVFENAVWRAGGFDNWNKSALTDNAAEAPDETMTAAVVVHNGGNFSGFEQVISVGEDEEYAGGFWVRARPGFSTSLVLVLADDRTGSGAGGHTIDDAEITLTSEWQRVSVAGVTGTGTTELALMLRNDTADTDQEFEVWGAQINEGDTLLDYAKTTDTPRL